MLIGAYSHSRLCVVKLQKGVSSSLKNIISSSFIHGKTAELAILTSTTILTFTSHRVKFKSYSNNPATTWVAGRPFLTSYEYNTAGGFTLELVESPVHHVLLLKGCLRALVSDAEERSPNGGIWQDWVWERVVLLLVEVDNPTHTC